MPKVRTNVPAGTLRVNPAARLMARRGDERAADRRAGVPRFFRGSGVRFSRPECLWRACKVRLPEHRVRAVETRRDSRPMLAGRLGGDAGFRVLVAGDLFARGRGRLGRIGGIIFRIEPRHLAGRSGRRGRNSLLGRGALIGSSALIDRGRLLG